MKESIPLCYTRVWCRKHQAWLSFKTKNQDRFLVSPEGYFVELPDGSLARISPRTCFSLVDNLPAITLDELSPRKQLGDDAYFVWVPLRPLEQSPAKVALAAIQTDPLANLKVKRPFEHLERIMLLRMLENGILSRESIENIIKQRDESKRSIGELVILNSICNWETLLGHCLDMRPASRVDPPNLRAIIERREWELTGEILVLLDKINRTELSHALKLKREAVQALGQILTAMGACRSEDVQRCLSIQNHVKDVDSYDSVALIGKLLVSQKVITESDLEEALWKQRVSRQPLADIFVRMEACSQSQIDRYLQSHGADFQQAIDEAAMGNYLIKEKIITKTQVEEACRIQSRGRQVLGELLVAYGLCKTEDIEDVMALQKHVREAYRSGVERLGALLVRLGAVPERIVEEALAAQAIGRQPVGAILTAIGACTAHDINLALEIQKSWRARRKEQGDRLGEVLVKHGILNADQLQAPLLEHMRDEKPLGRILVESGTSTPEQIVGALLERDRVRQAEFLTFVADYRRDTPAPVDHEVSPTRQEVDAGKLVSKITALSKSRQGKEKN